jgi:DNA-binding CsgD family transcriptional regulator
MRFIQPLEDHFGVNHFWYYRITNSGQYSYVGSHAKWNEGCLGERNDLLKGPYLRHPDTVTSGISLMKNTSDPSFTEVLATASEQFGINFNIHLLKKTAEGVEGYGFATHQKFQVSDNHLLNELPLLIRFAKQFRKENAKIFDIIFDNSVDLTSILGSSFYKGYHTPSFPKDREDFIRKMGAYEEILALSTQEMLIFKALANGFTAPYISKKLFLSTRTIENYIANIKQKLFVDSKIELIELAKEFTSLEKIQLDF